MVFGLFKKNASEDVTVYADVVVVSLQKAAYYADARNGLIELLDKAIADSPTGNVVVEMQKVTQFTSGPLGALVVSARKAEEKGGKLALAASVSGFVGKVLSTATTSSESPSYPDVRAALSAMSTQAASAYDKAN
ncbi:MAG: STAS domain-containing protein [Pikeienuella sp.]